MLKYLKALWGEPATHPSANDTSATRARARQKHAERTLRQSEEHFEQLVAGIRDYAIFLLDKDGYVLTWNAGAERIKGYAAHEIIGHHFSEFYPAEVQASGWPAHELEVAGQTGRFEDESWRVRKDGSLFWANVVITTLRDDDGNVRGFLKITQDLTARKQAEEKLRLSEERFRLLVDQVQEYAIYMLDPQGRIATWNLGAQRLKGYTADEIIGEHFSRFYTPADKAAGTPARALATATAQGQYEAEGWRVRKDGKQFWASVVVTALHNESGALIGFAKVTRDMTERKRAEEDQRRLLQEEAAREAAEITAQAALRAKEEERRHRNQLHVTLASIGDAVIVTDMQGHVTFMNPVAVNLTGWSLNEAASQPLDRVFRIVNEESRKHVENPVTQVLREGTVVGLANHTILLAKDGRETPIDDSAAPIRGEAGAIAGVVLVFRDVTEARRAVEVRRHLAAIVESSDDAIISEDLDGTIISWNHAAERLYGYTADEIVGKPLSILVPPDHPDELPSILDHIRRGERLEHFETVRMHKDGTGIEVSLTISPVKNADGKIVGASKIARDISLQKRHEAGLRFLADASKQLGELLDVQSLFGRIAASAVPLFADWCVIDTLQEDGSLRRVGLLQADSGVLRVAGEIESGAWRKHSNLPGAGRVMTTGEAEMATDLAPDALEALALSGEHLRKLQESRWRSHLSVPLAARGRTLGVLTFGDFELGRRLGGEELRVAKDLASRISIAIENAQLYEELKRSDQQKNEWIAMLAHELRNPLAPIRNALHIMKLQEPASEMVEAARGMMERQVHQLVRLVDDLLDVTRIIRGHIELRRETIDLATVIAQGIETAQPAIDSRGHELTVSLPDDPLTMTGDAARLAQVISNLLHNAAKFSEKAGRIWLTAERHASDIVVSVRDEGEGISSQLLPHIFDLFTQGDRSLERQQGGLGIGLTVVKRLVQLHGGSIQVASAGLGKGAEFVIRLPAQPPASCGEGDQAAVPPEQTPPSRSILVVDDNVDGAETIAMLLRALGHEVRLAHNGPEALSVAREQVPQIMILDIGLPGMSGYDVARVLRQDERFRDTLLIAITGYGQQEDRRRSLEAGFNEHLVKPVEIGALSRILSAPQ